MIKALQQGITDPNSFKSTNICVKSGNTRLVVAVSCIDSQRNRWTNIVCHLYICNCWSFLNEQSELSFATRGVCLYVCLSLSLINDKHTIVWKCIGRYLSFGREQTIFNICIELIDTTSGENFLVVQIRCYN